VLLVTKIQINSEIPSGRKVEYLLFMFIRRGHEVIKKTETEPSKKNDFCQEWGWLNYGLGRHWDS
jgi:hypothetical protein